MKCIKRFLENLGLKNDDDVNFINKIILKMLKIIYNL